MALVFTKMHGAGNDFIFLNALAQNLSAVDFKILSQKICDRRLGIGADQVLIVYSSTLADFRMAIYNADGSVAEMCGNAVRCFAKYVLDQKLTTKTEIKIETLGGIVVAQVLAGGVRVDMGVPREIVTNVILSEVKDLMDHLGRSFASLRMTTLSMGNPHAVVFVDDVKNFPVARVGALIENHKHFPNRTNVEFVQILNRTHVLQRTWERGSGETLACGTGASAVCVASVQNALTERKITVSLAGGDLEIEWDAATNHVFKTGPAVTVFEGVFL